MVPCFGNPFNVAMAWIYMLIHSDYLGLSGDLIEEFLDVITEHRANVMAKLLCVFKKHDNVEGEIVGGFSFAMSR